MAPKKLDECGKHGLDVDGAVCTCDAGVQRIIRKRDNLEVGVEVAVAKLREAEKLASAMPGGALLAVQIGAAIRVLNNSNREVR